MVRTRTRGGRWALIAFVAAAMLAPTGCSSSAGTAAGGATRPLHETATTTTEPRPAGPTVDACAVLMPTAAATVAGGPVKADNTTTIMPTKGPAPVKCQYQAANQQLVVVVVTKRTQPLQAVLTNMRKSNNKLVAVTGIGDAAFFDNSTVGLFVVFAGDWLMSFSGPKSAPLSAWKALAPSAVAALPR